MGKARGGLSQVGGEVCGLKLDGGHYCGESAGFRAFSEWCGAARSLGRDSCFFMGECAFAVLVTFILNKAS